MNKMYSSWEEILFSEPQGSILGRLLFNILKLTFLVMQMIILHLYRVVAR